METIQGSCLCGAIHYRSNAEPSKIRASDCRHCQKQSGAAISISVGVPGESLALTGPRPTVYEEIRDSGAVILRSFCPTCGTPLFAESDDEPDLVFIKTATLDDPATFEPPISKSPEISGYRHSRTANGIFRNVFVLPGRALWGTTTRQSKSQANHMAAPKPVKRFRSR